MNICRRCEGKFYVAGNPDDACMGDRKHQAMYDWSKSDDVLLCEIWLWEFYELNQASIKHRLLSCNVWFKLSNTAITFPLRISEQNILIDDPL